MLADSLLRSFRSRNYRLFFVGQSIAVTGTWLTIAALAWLMYTLNPSPLLLGLMGFCKHAPTFLLAPFGGVLVDHVSRRRVIVFAQAADMVTVSLLAFWTQTGMVTETHVLVASVLLGISKAFEMPARQALVADIVDDRAHLSNAIALNSTIFHGGRLVGPMLAGMLIIPFFGEAACFWVHAGAYVFAMLCFGTLRPKPMPPRTERVSIPRQMREGFAYAFGYAPVRALLLLLMVFSFLGQAYNTLLPVFAETVLSGGSGTYGLLLAASGLGAMMSAIHLATRKSVLGLGTVIFQSVVLFSLTLALFAMSTHRVLSVGLLLVNGMAGINVMVGSNTIIQTLVEDRLRGRVMSLMGMVFMGAFPLGSLLYGRMAELLGAPFTLMVGAGGCLAAGLAFRVALPRLREHAAPVYRARGILPQT